MKNHFSELAAVVLAAGSSKRFGKANKLHAKVEDESVVERVLNLVAQFPFQRIVVVSSPGDEELEKVAVSYPVDLVCNEKSEQGIGTSVATAVEALEESDVSGVVFFLGDLPFMKAESVAKIANAFVESKGTHIVRANFSGQPGHPLVVPRDMFSELKMLDGDQGAGLLVRKYPARLLIVETDDPGTIRDIDTPKDLGQ